MIKISILLLLFVLTYCGTFKKKHKPKQPPKPSLEETYNYYLTMSLVKQGGCDNGVMNGIAFYSTGDLKYWQATLDSFDNGKPYRTPQHDCHSSGRSGSTSSRDDLIGKYLALSKAFELGLNTQACRLVREHLDFFNSRYRRDGYPFRFAEGKRTRIYITPNITFIFHKLAKKCSDIQQPRWLKIGAQHQFTFPYISSLVPKPGYQRHLMALTILIFYDSIKLYKPMKKYAKALRKGDEQQYNGLLWFVDGILNTGNFDKPRQILKKFMVHDKIYANKYNGRSYMWMNRYNSDPNQHDYLNYNPDPNSDKIHAPLDRVFLYYLLYKKGWTGLNIAR